MKKFLTLTIASLMLTACASNEVVADPSLKETYWKLTELNGQPVKQGHKDTYIIFKQESNRVNGSGGCNGISGTYKEKPNGRLKFGPIMATQMACDILEQETKFLQVLEKADSYVIANGHLQLNRARMAPLARFEPVYLP